MAAEVKEKIIRIDVVASANAQRSINALVSDMKKIETASSNMQRTVKSSFSGMEGTFSKFASFFGAFGLSLGLGAMTKAILDSATAYQVLESRMKLVLGTQERAELATQRIVSIALITGRELDGVSKLYEKAARAAQQFGITEEQVSQITLGFAQSIRLSGSSTQEAYASMVQFGQALASGRLQGDEFRSLMENNSVFMYEFAKAANVSVSALRKMGTEGKLSAKFLFETMAKEGADGLNMMERLNKMAGSVGLTFTQSLTSLKSALTAFVGEAAKILDAKSDDEFGIFGPLVRGVAGLTAKIKELNKEAAAMQLGPLEKLMLLVADFQKNHPILSMLINPGAAFVGAVSNAVAPVNRALPFAERIAQQLDLTKKELSAAEKELDSLKKKAAAIQASGNLKFATELYGGKIAAQQSEVARLASVQRSLQAELNSTRYGERVDPNYGKKPPKLEPTAEELRKAKAARDALEDFVAGQRKKLEANQMLLRGEEDRKQTSKALVDLDEKLAAAGVKLNSVYATTARAIIAANDKTLDALDLKKNFEKATQTETDVMAKNIEKAEESIARDNATIEGLQNKTKASQEYTTQLLKEQRALAGRDLKSAKGSGMEATDPGIVKGIKEYINVLDRAIAKRSELEETQSLVKQDKEQNKIDALNERRLQNSADEINNALTQGLEKGNFGEKFFQNIQETMKRKAIDVVVNPITSIFSRKLAELADAFGTLLSQQLSAALISDASTDRLGDFIGNLGIFQGFAGKPLATGMSYVPYDEFPAILHKGERVMTAAENSEYSGRGAVTIHSNPVINIDSRTDQAQVYQIALEATQRGNVALVEELRAQGALA